MRVVASVGIKKSLELINHRFQPVMGSGKYTLICHPANNCPALRNPEIDYTMVMNCCVSQW
uniref:Uncharacterized protein n=1 Tax=Apteryx owenii TaxID=8824 RepID=A0A8B9PR10_APTOW